MDRVVWAPIVGLMFFLDMLCNSSYFQIVGEIKAAREALVEVTSRLRSFTYRNFFQKDIPSPAIPASSPARSTIGADKNSFNNTSPSQQNYSVNDVPTSIYQNTPAKPISQPVKVS